MSHKEKLFWQQDATIDDIAGVPPVSLKKCLDAIIPEIEQNLTLPEDRKLDILEIGCGIGRLTYPVRKHFKESTVVGIDISSKFLKIARSNYGHAKHHPIFIKTQGTKTTVGPFDVVYSMLVFQHLPNTVTYNYILDAGKHLRSGGVLRFQYVEGNIQHENRHDLSRLQVERYIKDAGLKLVKVDEGLIFPEWNWITAVKP